MSVYGELTAGVWCVIGVSAGCWLIAAGMAFGLDLAKPTGAVSHGALEQNCQRNTSVDLIKPSNAL